MVAIGVMSPDEAREIIEISLAIIEKNFLITSCRRQEVRNL